MAADRRTVISMKIKTLSLARAGSTNGQGVWATNQWEMPYLGHAAALKGGAKAMSLGDRV